MSQVNANSFKDATGGNNAVLSGVASPPNSMGFRNRIINGDMRIDQRNGGASVTINTASDTYTLDRFSAIGQSADGVYTVARSSVAPAGFTNSLLVTVTTADSSIGASQFYDFSQFVEGFNVADLGWGAAGAATVTLSFWVRSSVTGTFGGALRNASFNRSYPFSYTISAANTWEQKSVTIAGDTTGTWGTTNGVGIGVTWSLGEGSSRLSAAGAWAAGNFAGATGQTNLIATNGATFYITGVQLEAGTVASNFERVDYGRQMIQCQRYYQLWQFGYSDNVTTIGTRYFVGSFPVEMRATPTVGGTSALEPEANVSSVAVGPLTVRGARYSITPTASSSVFANRLASLISEL